MSEKKKPADASASNRAKGTTPQLQGKKKTGVGGKLSAIKDLLLGGGGGKKKQAPAPRTQPLKKSSQPHAAAVSARAPIGKPGKKLAIKGGVALTKVTTVATVVASSVTVTIPVKAKRGGKRAAAPVIITSLSPLTSRGGGKSISTAIAVSGDSVCREIACEGLATTAGYCRLHYLKNWKKIKRKELILKERKLNHYIEELVVKYPDKYIEAIRQDLESDKDFAKVIVDLDLDEGGEDFVEGESDSDEAIIDNIKREFDDSDSEGF